MQGIDHLREFMCSLDKILISGVKVVKHGSIREILHIVSELKDLVKEAPAVLPELKDLDSSEAIELTELAYKIVKDILDAVAV